MRLKSKHIKYAGGRSSYLVLRHDKNRTDVEQLEDLFAHAKELGVRHIVRKTLSGARERTSTALRRILILAKDFDTREVWEKIRLLRHELAHVRQQRDLLFFLRYLVMAWRWAYEVAAERESVRYLAERGWNDARIKVYIDDFVKRLFESKILALKRLDGDKERELTRELLWSAVQDGRDSP